MVKAAKRDENADFVAEKKDEPSARSSRASRKATAPRRAGGESFLLSRVSFIHEFHLSLSLTKVIIVSRFRIYRERASATIEDPPDDGARVTSAMSARSPLTAPHRRRTGTRRAPRRRR